MWLLWMLGAVVMLGGWWACLVVSVRCHEIVDREHRQRLEALARAVDR